MKPRAPRATPPLWAIAEPTGCIVFWTVRYSRKEAIDVFVGERQDLWERRQERGYRAVKVRVAPEPQKRAARKNAPG